MILFLYGDDTFRSRRYLSQSIEKFKRERDPAGYNVISLEALKVEPSRIFAEMASAPFLAAKRLIIVENVLSLSDKEALSTLTEKISENRIPESNVVIFVQTEPVGKTKEAKLLYEKLKTEKFAQEFNILTPEKTAGWINKEIEDRGGKIGHQALSFMTANCGGDLWLAESTLNQLLAYTAGREINLEDVELFLDVKLDDNVFALVESLTAGRKKQAMQLLYEQRQLGQDDFQIYNLMLWQFRALYTIADLLGREPGLTSDVIAGKTKLHPFVVKKNLAVARSFTAAKLAAIITKLQGIDFKAKTGRAELPVMLDEFVASL